MKVMVIPTNEELVVAREVETIPGDHEASRFLRRSEPRYLRQGKHTGDSRPSTFNSQTLTFTNQSMAHQAIGMIETRGLVALVEGTDAMLKAANVELAGPMTQVGNALVTAVVVGDVAAVKAATDAGAQAIKAIKGELVSVHVIARPHADVEAVLPKKPVGEVTVGSGPLQPLRAQSSFTQPSSTHVMFLARVEGSVVATKKDPSMSGRKLLLLRPQLVDDKDPTKFRPGSKHDRGRGQRRRRASARWCCSARAAPPAWRRT